MLEEYLCLRFGGLIFGRAYVWGGGGAYYRNFTVSATKSNTTTLFYLSIVMLIFVLCVELSYGIFIECKAIVVDIPRES